MQIKIIDLLNLVYEKKAPRKILYKYCEYEFNYVANDYVNKDGLALFQYLFQNEEQALYKEVEIIEERPEKIDEFVKTDVVYENCEGGPKVKIENKYDYTNEEIYEKLNELIRGYNYLLKKEDDKK